MNRSELVGKLQLVGRALADNSLVPVFTHFMFWGGEVMAYNDRIGIQAPCQIGGAFAVSGNTLLNLLCASTGEEVVFTVQGQEVQIKAGRSKFNLPYFEEKDFLFKPPSPAFDFNTTIDIKLIEGIAACLTTSGRDEAQAALMGVCFDTKQVTLYSCDSDALTRYSLSRKAPKVGNSYVFPNQFCEALLKVASDTKWEKAGLQVSNEWVQATFDNGFILYGRIIEVEKLIEYEKLIEASMKHKAEFVAVPKELNAALSRARVVADAESAPTKVTLGQGKMILVTTSRIGEVRDVMKHASKTVLEIKVNAERVQRAIGLCNEMAIFENCTAYSNGRALFQLLGNMGD